MVIALIAHNIRSIHNVGSILRTADGFGVAHVYFSGYTPYPTTPGDMRLQHVRERLTRHIHKTALGAETTMPLTHHDDLAQLLQQLRDDGYSLVALEQDTRAVPLPTYQPGDKKIALLLGEEVHGIDAKLLALCDQIVEIPMYGGKESFNVSVATGITLYQLREAPNLVHTKE